MLIDSGETDASVLKLRLNQSFVVELQTFVAGLDLEYRPFSVEEMQDELTLALGRYLISASAGSGLDQEDFIAEMVLKFGRWPRSVVLDLMEYAAQSCPWPRDLPGWMGSEVSRKMQVAMKQREQASTLLQIWDNK